jgi:protein-S-isoprenylcysteine O-methyltransferase Ste14
VSLMLDFEIGLWNAWVLQVLFFLTLSISNLLMSKEARERTKRATQFVPLSGTQKIMAYSTHFLIMPFTVIYSIVLPLKIGTVWLYVGFLIFSAALVMTLMTTHSFATTPLNEPVTKGIYRISRHPTYLSGFFLYVGMGVACLSWVMALCGVLWAVLWNSVVPVEERFLLEKYGESYREYMERTPRWIGVPKSGKSTDDV